ncbi:DUF4304 domain-containing protein [Chelatococcus asaccharovorans]|uniref:Uncharacterized protein DUF4304 n=1 Tax=Chelatococcus asaccharovorans TaxID=28210 RepID=A0A2V3TY84_9HYPH|nr:DUF4304 domain-containing protein [Chelatococcus asaccharovorans]MBS7704843.1 DUF4304 domain-containing protein [Chelatococcus asaccharovorans]PXW54740.1 uncharacterized protein DUF4304 [Chelatococcus asaccharovorans]
MDDVNDDDRKEAIRRLKASLGVILKPEGYRAQDLNWRKTTDDAILVVNVQRSMWGQEAFINLGVFSRRLGDHASPKAFQCHLTARIGQLAPEMDEKLQRITYRSLIQSDAMLTAIDQTMRSRILPLLDVASTYEGQRHVIASINRANNISADGWWVTAHAVHGLS